MTIPRIEGGMRLADTWASRFTVLARGVIALVVASVALPVAVSTAITLWNTLAAAPGEDFTSPVISGSLLLVFTAAVVGILASVGVRSIIWAFTPIDPIYGEVATGAAVIDR